MKKFRRLLLAFASASAINAASAATIAEDFSVDPMQNGWSVFGDSNLFQWDSTNQRLHVTWDSSKTNSYLYQPIGTILARDDDFSIAFDLFLNDIESGTEPGKTGPMQIALGFQNFAGATNSGFMRGSFGGAPNVVEFNYFTSGFYDFGGIFEVNPTTTPAFISRGGFGYAPTAFSPYEVEIPTALLVRVTMEYTASNQTMAVSLSTNGLLMAQLPNLALTNSAVSGFNASDDFRVDTLSVISYSSFGNDFDSVFAHGYVDNLEVTVPAGPVQNLIGKFNNDLWQVQFQDRTNWVYTLERTVDLQTWSDVSETVVGIGGTQILTDTNSPSENGFYRIRANRP